MELILLQQLLYVPERDALHKKIPSYKCKNEGLVRVNIKVARNGKVVSFEIMN